MFTDVKYSGTFSRVHPCADPAVAVEGDGEVQHCCSYPPSSGGDGGGTGGGDKKGDRGGCEEAGDMKHGRVRRQLCMHKRCRSYYCCEL